MKIILAGGSGYLGNVLSDYYKDKANEIIILSRTVQPRQGNIRTVVWDGKNTGQWVNELEAADLLVNFTGKSVNCRYNETNKREILASRINSTSILGRAILSLKQPPGLWIQSSSATIYRHSEDRPMDEEDGEIGEGFSVNVCMQWEKAFWDQDTPATRKVVLRTGIVLGRKDGVLPRLINLAKMGAGKQGNGHQFVSWIHERDVANVVEWIRINPLISGTFNCTAPEPVPNALMMKQLQEQLNIPFSITMPRWLLNAGAVIIGTETELIFKSRWVIPARLVKAGYQFEFPSLALALQNILTDGTADKNPELIWKIFRKGSV